MRGGFVQASRRIVGILLLHCQDAEKNGIERGGGLKKADIIPIAAVLAAAVILIFVFSAKPSNTVRITCAGCVYEYPLSENRTIELEENGISLTVVIENGSVRVEKSTCRDQICVHTHAGNIVCMPARVVITLEDGEYDYVAG